jgi:pimeloyl-ACP methyl ester carboxylesterase
MKFAELFDPTAARRPSYGRLWREAWSLLTCFPPAPDPMPVGRGHVVLVIPAFLTTDAVTAPLRRHLERCDYRVFGWGLGINWGPTPRLCAGLRARLTELVRLAGGKVSVVGVSLGGLLARDLAHDRTAHIRNLVTLAAACRLPTASTIAPLFRLTLPFYAPAIDIARLSQPLPVPTMTIYTSDDGIVAWENCRDEVGAAVDVGGAHLAICRNPAALDAVARWLQPERMGNGRSRND